ncbi:hypothetical protein PR202_ga12061 [Eleusine coracana subsp. coracana]|uniref:F-box domain-containing protein n=1 Tax=Eleusine coracana subsp. coracana TaxID=191504 RepID=A0AAV5CAM9_ELECO|nr:hypothetical protein PR202_ga12061 [Eleusine coracana subsp. coracana]
MGKNRRLRRPYQSRATRPDCRNMAGETSRCNQPTNISDLTDDLLELVHLSTGSPFCLVRAATTCKLWRSVIAGAGFLCHFHSLHGPHILGHYYTGTNTTFVPSPAPPGETGIWNSSTYIFGAFLLDANEPGVSNMSNFRLLCMNIDIVRDNDIGGNNRIARASVYSAKDTSWMLLSSTAVVGANCDTSGVMNFPSTTP